MKLSRKYVLGAATGAYGALNVVRFPAGAAEFNYKFSITVAATEPLSLNALQAASKIFHESNGRLDIRVYPNSALGGDVESLEQVRLGSIEFAHLGNLVVANVVQVAGIAVLPFIFSSNEQAWSVYDGALGKYVTAAAAKYGLYHFGHSWEANFNNTFNNLRPIVTPPDVKGMKIRIQPGPVLTALFKGLGANPVSISFNAVYSALQTKLIDGATTGSSYVETSKLYEVLKYASLTNHIWSVIATIANPGAMDRLPKNLRDMVEKHFVEAAYQCRTDSRRLDDAVNEKLRTQGMEVNKADVAAFRAEVRKIGLYNQWRSQYGDEAWAILEKGVGPLT